jgi:hypothetical protein
MKTGPEQRHLAQGHVEGSESVVLWRAGHPDCVFKRSEFVSFRYEAASGNHMDRKHKPREGS